MGKSVTEQTVINCCSSALGKDVNKAPQFTAKQPEVGC